MRISIQCGTILVIIGTVPTLTLYGMDMAMAVLDMDLAIVQDLAMDMDSVMVQGSAMVDLVMAMD